MTAAEPPRLIPTVGQLSAAAQRNRDPILSVLRRVLQAQGLVLEIASGTGEHAVHFAANLPGVTWQPTDQDAEYLSSITAHRVVAALPNLLAPLVLDVSAPAWPVEQADAIVCINMIHIAPWSAAEGLMTGAARLLPAAGVLFLYGPYTEGGRHNAPSNEAFDAYLRARNPEWGVRDLGDVRDLAVRHGFEFVERVMMPANNFSVVFRRH